MDELNFRFKAYAEDDKIVVHVKVDGAEAVFRYTNTDAISALASNMEYILDYAIEDYMLSKKFKEQIDNGLEDWLKDEG